MRYFLLSIISALVLSIAVTPATGQIKNDAFYVELGGNGFTFTANYDTRFTKNEEGGFGGRLGIGYVGSEGDGTFSLPLGLNYLLGKEGKYFELGLGATYLSNGPGILGSEDDQLVGNLTFMYRKQPIDGGFMWRIGFSPIFTSDYFFPMWLGVGLGYAF